MIAHGDTVFILARVAAEPDRTKKLAGLRLLALMRRDQAAEPLADSLIRHIAQDLGAPAGDHALGLLRTAGLA